MIRSKLASSSNNFIAYKRIYGPLIPYVTVGIGLLLLNNAWIAIVGYHFCMIMILLIARERISRGRISSGRGYGVAIITAIAGGCGGLLLYLLWPFLGIPGNFNLYLNSIGLNANTWPYFIVYFILVNALFEEYYWRGYLGSISKRITVNDLLFSGYHIIVLAGKINIVWLLVVFICLSAAAWFWRQADRWNHGVLTSIVSHVAADASIIMTIYFLSNKG